MVRTSVSLQFPVLNWCIRKKTNNNNTSHRSAGFLLPVCPHLHTASEMAADPRKKKKEKKTLKRGIVGIKSVAVSHGPFGLPGNSRRGRIKRLIFINGPLTRDPERWLTFHTGADGERRIAMETLKLARSLHQSEDFPVGWESVGISVMTM